MSVFLALFPTRETVGSNYRTDQRQLSSHNASFLTPYALLVFCLETYLSLLINWISYLTNSWLISKSSALHSLPCSTVHTITIWELRFHTVFYLADNHVHQNFQKLRNINVQSSWLNNGTPTIDWANCRSSRNALHYFRDDLLWWRCSNPVWFLDILPYIISWHKAVNCFVLISPLNGIENSLLPINV